MGQYYKPLSLGTNGKPSGWVYSHDVKIKCTRSDGSIFWMGNGLKLMEHSWIGNKFVAVVENMLAKGGLWYKTPIVWAGDYADKEAGTDENLYDWCNDENQILPGSRRTVKKNKYIVNHTSKQYVDKTKGINKDGWMIHPLPLLTCEGNNRGGGDFRGDEKDLVGLWARDIISVESEIPADYSELIFDLYE